MVRWVDVIHDQQSIIKVLVISMGLVLLSQDIILFLSHTGMLLYILGCLAGHSSLEDFFGMRAFTTY